MLEWASVDEDQVSKMRQVEYLALTSISDLEPGRLKLQIRSNSLEGPKKCHERSSSNQLMRRMLIWIQIAFTVIPCDLFAVYLPAGSSNRLLGRFFQARTRWSVRLFMGWTMILTLASGYASTKMALIAISRLSACSYQQQHYTHLPRESQDWPRSHYNWLLKTLGDPFNQFAPAESVLLYGNVAVCGLFVVCYWPLYCLGRPLDAPKLRFFIEPKLETRRIELLIVEQLEVALQAAKMSLVRCLESEAIRASRLQVSRQLILADQQRRLIEQQLEQAQSLKPSDYSAQAHDRDFRRSFWTLVIMVSGNLLGGPFCIYMIVYIWFKRFCEQTGQCNLIQLLERTDLLTFIQFVGVQIMCTVAATVYSWLLMIEIQHQMDACHIFQTRLKECVRNLRFKALVGRRGSWLKLERELTVDADLLTTLIQFRLLQEELHRSSILISELGQLLVGVASVCGLFSFGARNLACGRTSPRTEMDAPAIILGGCLIYANCLIASPAAVPSQVIRIKRLIWTLMAELANRGAQFRGRIVGDPISVLWRKSVVARTFNEDNHAAIYFGQSIQFDILLKFNYFVISLVLLLRAYT